MELFGFFWGIVFSILISSIIYPMPLSDNRDVRYKSIPWMVAILIFINSLIFLFLSAPDQYAFNRMMSVLGSGEITSEEQLYTEFSTAFKASYNDYERSWLYGFRGTNVFGEGASIGGFTTFTSIFMHADFNHLFYNMLVLWAFGRRVEDATGSWRFLIFYLSAGLIANIGSEVLNTASADIPGIGASGAIFGVMGAYLLLFPGARIRCAWGIGIVLRMIGWAAHSMMGFEDDEEREFKWTIELPAFIVGGVFAIENIRGSLQAINNGGQLGGVNTIAHMAGLLGALIIFLYVRKDLLVRYLSGRRL